MTAKPPSLCISRAESGETMASMAAAMTGVDRVMPSTEKSVLVISGLTVTPPGTMDTSSNP